MLLTHVIKAPVITEKTSEAQVGGKYTFRVHSKATKVDVQNAVQQAYGVEVIAVNMLKTRKKERRVGRSRFITKRPASKKAIVTLKSGQSIDFNKLKPSK